MELTTLSALSAAICLMWAAPALAQIENKFSIPLKINVSYEQPMGYLIIFPRGRDTGEPAYSLSPDSSFGLG